MFRHLARVACVLVSLVTGVGVAHAGDVSGRVELPSTAQPAQPLEYKGFLDRAENPTLAVKAFDPTPYIVVVLVPSGTVEAPAPSGVGWDLVGDSFGKPLIAVRTGAEVTIKNKSKRVVMLGAAEDAKLIPAEPINPTGSRPFTPKTAGLITVGDKDLPHLHGRVVVVDSPYFAIPDAKGSFTIKDVPAGEYKVKVWYMDGWLDRPDDSVTQDKKGDATVNPKITAFKKQAG